MVSPLPEPKPFDRESGPHHAAERASTPVNSNGSFSSLRDLVRETSLPLSPANKSGAVERPVARERGRRLNDAALESHNLNPAFSFNSFVVGPCNRVAQAAALTVCDGCRRDTGRDYNPLVLYGGHGTGKTHLLQSACRQLLESSRSTVICQPCEEFTNRFLTSLESGSLKSFRASYRGADVLALDDIDFLIGKERTRQEFFRTLTFLVEAGKQVVVTSFLAPRDCVEFERRLKSRLQSGLVAPLDPPDVDTRVTVLLRKARARGCALPADVAEFVASRITSDLRELEGALSRILHASRSTRAPITVETARLSLTDLLESSRPSGSIAVARIIQEVQGYFHLGRKELLSRSKARSVAYARQTGMYLTRKLTRLSLGEIGRHFGGRDHTTVLYALGRIQALAKERPEVRATLRALESCIIAPR